MKKFFFISGMPRSGSTLLANILAQNSRFHTTQTSGCLDVLFGVRNNWDKLVEHKSHPNPETLKRVLKSVLFSYYDDVEKPVIFDKSRGWIAHLEMIEDILGYSPKILVPVRPIANILSSFEKLYRETAKVRQPPGEAENYFQFQTVDGRCQFWSRPESPVGLAYNRVLDCIQRGHKNKLYFVSFNSLTSDPHNELSEIYNFLEEEHYSHNFDYVEQVTQEDDSVHGFVNLHKIKSRVQPVKNDAYDIIGQVNTEKYNKIMDLIGHCR